MLVRPLLKRVKFFFLWIILVFPTADARSATDSGSAFFIQMNEPSGVLVQSVGANWRSPVVLDSIELAFDAIFDWVRTKDSGAHVDVFILPGKFHVQRPIEVDFRYFAAGVDLRIRGVGLPILDGAIRVSDVQEKVGKLGRLWTSSTVRACMAEQLLVDGHFAVRARSPNLPRRIELRRDGIGNPSSRPVGSKTEFFLDPKELRDSIGRANAVSGVVAVVGQEWEQSRHPVLSFSLDDGLVKLGSKSHRDFLKLGSPQLVYFENSSDFLDAQAEWHLDRQSCLVSYLPLDEQRLPSSRISLPINERLIEIRNVPMASSLSIEGIAFEGAAVHTDVSGFSDEQASISLPASVSIADSSNVFLSNLMFSAMAGYALDVSGLSRNISIKKSRFSRLGGGGIKVGLPILSSSTPSRVVVAENTFSHTGLIFPGAVPVLVGAGDQISIADNVITATSYSGISIGWFWGYGKVLNTDVIVERNILSGIGDGNLNDLGGVYVLGGAPGTIIRNNIICGVRGSVSAHKGLAWGIYADEGASDLIIHGNFISNAQAGGFHLHYGRNVWFTNNFLGWSGSPQVNVTRREPHLSLKAADNIISSPVPISFNDLSSVDFAHNKIYWLNSFSLDSRLAVAGLIESWVASLGNLDGVVSRSLSILQDDLLPLEGLDFTTLGFGDTSYLVGNCVL